MENCAAPSHSSWGHDLFMMAFAAGATCAAIAAYNCYIDRQGEDKGNENEDGKKGGVRGVQGGFPEDLASGAPEDHGAVAARELVTSLAASLAHVDGVTASGNMLSAILAQLWSHMSAAIASTVKEIVEPILMDTLPVKVQFTKLDLGKVPIKASAILTRSCTSQKGDQEHEVLYSIVHDIRNPVGKGLSHNYSISSSLSSSSGCIF